MREIELNDNAIVNYYDLNKYLYQDQSMCFKLLNVSKPILIWGLDEPYLNVNQDYHVIKCDYKGGLIVCGENDIILLYVGAPDITKKIIVAMQNFVVDLNNKTNYNFCLSGNDIIVDNQYKIGSRAGWLFQKRGVVGVFLSKTDSEKEICKLCTKPRKYQSTNFNKLGIDNMLLNNLIQKHFYI